MWRIPEGFPCVCLEPVSPARYPASWHFFLQMELKAGKGASERPGPDWKAALQREREEQQHLLAESYSAVMELTRQLQMSERHWSQEKLQLVERLQGEKQQVEQQVKELQNRLSQVRPFCRGNWSPELRESRESQALSSEAVFRAPRHTIACFALTHGSLIEGCRFPSTSDSLAAAIRKCFRLTSSH